MAYTLSTSGNVLTIQLDSLSKNSQYTVTLSPGISGVTPPSGVVRELENTYSFWFTSKYCPLFTTINRVKLQAGPTADQYTDDTIYRMIYRNSMEIIDIYNISQSRATYTYTAWGCGTNLSGVPIHFKRYVECKTAYDLLSLAKLSNSLSGGDGGQLKTLGDLTIKYGGKTTYNSAKDPERSEELYNCWKDSLRMIKNIDVAVIGWNTGERGHHHPAREFHHSRVIRPVNFSNSNPDGPWRRSREWSGYIWR